MISKVTVYIIIKYLYYFFSRDRIDRFIDENKALMKRMYGDFEMMENGPFPKAKRSTARKRRQDSSFSDNQSKPNKLPTRGQPADSGRYYSYMPV